MPESPIDRQVTSTEPEDLFATMFAQVFGVENTQLLAPQYPCDDIYGSTRYIDFALRTLEEKVAFEIDGLSWHCLGCQFHWNLSGLFCERIPRPTRTSFFAGQREASRGCRGRQ